MQREDKKPETYDPPERTSVCVQLLPGWPWAVEFGPDVRSLDTVHTHALTDTSRLLTDTAGQAVASPKNSPKNKQSH